MGCAIDLDADREGGIGTAPVSARCTTHPSAGGDGVRCGRAAAGGVGRGGRRAGAGNPRRSESLSPLSSATFVADAFHRVDSHPVSIVRFWALACHNTQEPAPRQPLSPAARSWLLTFVRASVTLGRAASAYKALARLLHAQPQVRSPLSLHRSPGEVTSAP
jgi:hypothetical protein